MKSNGQLIVIILSFINLGYLSNLSAQNSWSDYILEDRGDTVVVKPTSTTGYLNTLYHAIRGDTTASGERTNPNRVYETVRNEVYIMDGPAKFDATIPDLRIVAPDGDQRPPLHIKTTTPEGARAEGMFVVQGNFYIKNQYICQAYTNDTYNRGFLRISPGGRYEFDNCIFELTGWTVCANFSPGNTYKFTNCLLINIGSEATLEKGDVIDTSQPLDTVWFENNTILNHGTLILSRLNTAPGFTYFNHNTVVNATQHALLSHSQAEMVVTNNLFINTGIVPDYPGFYQFVEDEDQLPKGIINVDTLENAWIDDHWSGEYPYPIASDEERKILVDRNNAWWDPRFTDMFENDLSPFPDTIGAEWNSQMITMNSRTQAMFDDDAAYPYFIEGAWYNVEPDFANIKDNVPEWIDFIITNSTPGDPNGGNPQPMWRTNVETNLVTVDWPPFADLSYNQTALKTGGLNSYPLGDLNWFPDLKEEWELTSEADTLIANMNKGNIPEDYINVGIDEESLERFISNIEIFPNPFSDNAIVRFRITRPSDLELNVYNLLGERVLMLELGNFTAGVHEVSLISGDLTPGIYILQLNTDSVHAGMISKILIK